MSTRNDPRRGNEPGAKRVAIRFIKQNVAKVDLGYAGSALKPAAARVCRPPTFSLKKPVRLISFARMRAENKALRNQVVHLQVQWDIIRTLLGDNSSAVYSTEAN